MAAIKVACQSFRALEDTEVAKALATSEGRRKKKSQY
jgi:hypothetical protein